MTTPQAIFFTLLIVGLMALATPSDEDLTQCEKIHSTETCLHTLYP